MVDAQETVDLPPHADEAQSRSAESSSGTVVETRAATVGSLTHVDRRSVRGWVMRASDAPPPAIEVGVDDCPVQTVVADAEALDIDQDGDSNRWRFEATLSPDLRDGQAHSIVVRVAEEAIPFGSHQMPAVAVVSESGWIGHIDRLDPHGIGGWLADPVMSSGEEKPNLSLLMDGQKLAELSVTLDRPDLAPQLRDTRCGFHLAFARELRDGQPHTFELRDGSTGESLFGGARTVVMEQTTEKTLCYALEQIFLDTAGNMKACDHARVNYFTPDQTDYRDLFEIKLKNSEEIFYEGDLSGCRSDCVCTYKAERKSFAPPHKLVVFTNSFCPLRCQFCALVYDNVVECVYDFPGDVPPVALPQHNVPDLANRVRRVFDNREARKWIKRVELTGGDSAYHPEFFDVIEVCAELGVEVIYLSSGLVPNKTAERLIEYARDGVVHVSVSVDAATPEAWERAKQRPAKQFERVSRFTAGLANANREAVSVKFIIMKDNLSDASLLVPYYASLGVKRVAISEYRQQPSHYTTPPTEEEVREAVLKIVGSRHEPGVPKDLVLIPIGTERFYDFSSL